METATTTASNAVRVAVKLSLANETHRVTLEQGDLMSFDALCALVPQTFAQATPKAWALVYTDNEGDLVTVSSASEFSEARRVFLELNGERKTMHFRVLPRVSVKDQIPPAVLQAVDELSSTIARMASDTRESISQSTYLERGRASVVYSAKQTREFLESARKEIAQRLKDVQARIVGEIERRRSSASSADEAGAGPAMEAHATLPSPSVEEEHASAEGIEMEARRPQHPTEAESDDEVEADDEKDSDDEDDEAEDKREEVAAPPLPLAAAAVEVVLQAVEAPREVAEAEEDQEAAAGAETPYESDAETVASSSSDEDEDDDSDWDVVPDVWNAEVALIRNILPHVHVEDCVEMLRKHNGSLEAAINELTDA